MISVDENMQVIVTNDSEAFALSKEEQYENFVLWITDPRKDAVDESAFEIDQNLETDSEERNLAERYAEFLKEYMKARNEIISEQEEEIIKSQESLNSAAEKISEQADAL